MRSNSFVLILGVLTYSRTKEMNLWEIMKSLWRKQNGIWS